jgi:hypothetical protein
VAKVNELISMDLGSLVEKDKGRERVSNISCLPEVPFSLFSA